MRFRILGLVEVRTEQGEVLHPKGRKQRLLLASLILYAPRMASAHRLIDMLWGDRAPEHPAAALRTQVSRLRGWLGGGDDGGDLLQNEPHGDRLAVAPEQVDGVRFESLLSLARDAALSERLALLDRALALWRGDPYEEFAELWQFQGEVTRLRELRAGAAEQRVESLLEIGRTNDALAAAEPLAREDPLRERPRMLQMRALYHAGRQHDALSAFQDYRRILSEELGLDPSPALQELELDILRHRHVPPAAARPGAATSAAASSDTASSGTASPDTPSPDTASPDTPSPDTPSPDTPSSAAASSGTAASAATSSVAASSGTASSGAASPPAASSGAALPPAVPSGAARPPAASSGIASSAAAPVTARPGTASPASPDPGPDQLPKTPSRLPLPLTRLIGRKQQLVSVRRLLRSMRLLTLTGAGGSGKTRLALEVARSAEDDFARRVVWVALDALSDPARVAPEVASALDVRERSDRSTIQSLGDALRERTVLLVLDNCEHLIDACASLAEALLRECPELVVLATSREPLGIVGETVWPVPPLPVPSRDDGAVEELARSEAVELFVDRARAAVPTFALTPENTAAVGHICRRLDGMPLALELAAARVRVLAPNQIADRLDDLFGLLSAGSRTALPRHRTLRATIDWSVALLGRDERALLERLSVFAGGFTLEAVDAVCSGEGIASRDVLDLFSGLVDKSLAIMQECEGEARHRLLESVRQYAAERLDAHGGSSELRSRHAEYFRSLAETAEPHLLGGAGDPAWIARMDREDRNLRAAADWCLADESRVDTALRLLSALHWYWFARGRFREGRRLLATALRLAEHAAPELRAKALAALGIVGVWQGDAASVLGPLAESVALQRAAGDERGLAYALTGLGAATLANEPASARPICAEAVALVRRQEPSVLTAFVLFWHGIAGLAVGDDDAAHAAFEEAVSIGRVLENKPCIAHPLTIFGRLEAARDRHAEAMTCLVESLAIHSQTRDLFGTILVLEGVAGVAAARGEPERAVRLFGAAEALRQTMGGPLLPFEESRYRQTIDGLARCMDADSHAAAWAEGQRLGFEPAVAYAASCIDRLS